MALDSCGTLSRAVDDTVHNWALSQGIRVQHIPDIPTPSIAGGIALALLIVQVAVRVLRFLPDTLEDSAIDPHAAKAD